MTTIEAVEEKLVKQRKTNNNTYLILTQSMKGWYRDELLFVRKVTKDSVVVFRSMDGQLHTLNNTNLINFKLL
jgi:hypothetical protein|tara:strand:- start:512 stop:730 length:219 start_codon:yes stop_codon:yes gene_type:complete